MEVITRKGKINQFLQKHFSIFSYKVTFGKSFFHFIHKKEKKCKINLYGWLKLQITLNSFKVN
jgi:carbonic anhydrase